MIFLNYYCIQARKSFVMIVNIGIRYSYTLFYFFHFSQNYTVNSYIFLIEIEFYFLRKNFTFFSEEVLRYDLATD